MIFLTKNFFCSSIANLQKMFYKRMLRILFKTNVCQLASNFIFFWFRHWIHQRRKQFLIGFPYKRVFARKEWQNTFYARLHNEQEIQRQRYTNEWRLQNCSHKTFVSIPSQFSTSTIQNCSHKTTHKTFSRQLFSLIYWTPFSYQLQRSPYKSLHPKTWFNEALVTHITLVIILKKLDNFTNSFLLARSQLTLPIPQMSQLPPAFYIQNALSTMFWASSNGKILYRKDNSLFLLNQLLTITWIIKWLAKIIFSHTRDSFLVL